MYDRNIFSVHGNAAMAIVTGQTPLSRSCYGTMVTICTNCSYQIPVKTLLNSLWYIDFENIDSENSYFVRENINMICRYIIQ